MTRATGDPFDVHELLAQAEGLPDGPAKVAVCEAATAAADARQDNEAAFQTRLALTSAACFGGRPDIMLVAYAWILAHYDADPHPSYARGYEVLWRYKWVLNAAGQFPQFSRERCEELLHDLARRYAAFGCTRHPALAAERGLMLQFQDLPGARVAHARLRRTRRDIFSNCEACDANSLVGYHVRMGRSKLAVAAAAPILSGQMTCHVVPMATYANLLTPLTRLGHYEQAFEYHILGYRLAARTITNTDEVAEHVEFLALTGNFDRAARLAGKHLPAADSSDSPAGRRYAFTLYRFVFLALAQHGTNSVRTQFSTGHPLHRPGGRVPVTDVLEWLTTETVTLAAAFDARNGNTILTESLERQPDQLKQIRSVPFPD